MTTVYDMEGVQERITAWRMNKPMWLDPNRPQLCMKLLEEAGEVARACVRDLEGRDGGGDFVQEAAQVVVVLCQLVGLFGQGRNLFAAVHYELDKLGVPE